MRTNLIQQELSTLRQGNLTVLQYFDAVEKNLILLTNKTPMSYDRTVAGTICEKYRADALRVFISRLKKQMCDIMFAPRPSDLPCALPLAQEVESNHQRYIFATGFAAQHENQAEESVKIRVGHNIKIKPYFTGEQHQGYSGNNTQQSTPMEVDPSVSRIRQPTWGTVTENISKSATRQVK